MQALFYVEKTYLFTNCTPYDFVHLTSPLYGRHSVIRDQFPLFHHKENVYSVTSVASCKPRVWTKPIQVLHCRIYKNSN
jgi:hypothetical protein